MSHGMDGIAIWPSGLKTRMPASGARVSNRVSVGTAESGRSMTKADSTDNSGHITQQFDRALGRRRVAVRSSTRLPYTFDDDIRVRICVVSLSAIRPPPDSRPQALLLDGTNDGGGVN